MDMFAKKSFENEKETLRAMITTIPKKGQTAIQTMMDGYTQVEVSQIYGISQPVISYYLKCFQAQVMRELQFDKDGDGVF